jgi:hypothetical protein
MCKETETVKLHKLYRARLQVLLFRCHSVYGSPRARQRAFGLLPHYEEPS